MGAVNLSLPKPLKRKTPIAWGNWRIWNAQQGLAFDERARTPEALRTSRITARCAKIVVVSFFLFLVLNAE